MLRRRDLIVSAIAVAAYGQQDEPTFTAGVKVVNVFATVRTKKGEIVHDLTKDDFSVLENGRAQRIQYFSRESELPLTLGLMVDTSMSQRKVLEAERGASFRFLDQVLRPDKDKVFVIQFDLSVMTRQNVTASRKELEEMLSLVDTPTRQDLSMQRGGGTLLYDAVVKGSAIMRDQKNRKALIVLTDGVDTGSEATLTAAIEAAQRADTIIYSILFSDEGYYGMFGGADGRGVLVRLAKETGGSFFEVSKKLTIDQVYTRIQEQLRSQYSLGFVSDEPVRVSEFRKLQVGVKQKGLLVETRDRYWAQR